MNGIGQSKSSAIRRGYERAGSVNRRSEAYFSKQFAAVLRKSEAARRFGTLDVLFIEFSGTVGIADIIGLSASDWAKTRGPLSKKLGRLSKSASAHILSRLGHRSYTPRKAIFENSRVSPRQLETTIRALCRAKIIDAEGDGYYRLNAKFRLPKCTISFFEMKIEDWRRALFQAAQAQSYADRVYCVFPIGRRELLQKHKQLFNRMGIGLVLFDLRTKAITELVKASSQKPKTPAHKVEMILRLADRKLNAPTLQLKAPVSLGWLTNYGRAIQQGLANFTIRILGH